MATELDGAAAHAGCSRSEMARRGLYKYLEWCGRDPGVLESQREALECRRRNAELESRIQDLERLLAAREKELARAQGRLEDVKEQAQAKVKLGKNVITYQDSLVALERPAIKARLEELAEAEESGLLDKLGQRGAAAGPPLLQPLFIQHKSWAAALAAVIA